MTTCSRAGRRAGAFGVLLALGLIVMTGVAIADPGNGNGAANASDNANGKGLVTASPDVAATDVAATTGDLNSPQPPSNADFTGNGANTNGAYDSTRDGSPSLNGNGGGKAVGKPCAGCVGKADNKNPKGQSPNGSDHNAGYECDTNNGIGKTNPAHTGCQPTTENPPPPPPPTDVLGNDIVRNPTEVLGLQLNRPAALATTGVDVARLVWLGLLLLVSGVALVMVARPSRRQQAVI